MKKVLLFVLTIITGYIGFMIGEPLGMEGYPGVVLAVATVGVFLLDEIENK